jgi:hypothetical protein
MAIHDRCVPKEKDFTSLKINVFSTEAVVLLPTIASEMYFLPGVPCLTLLIMLSAMTELSVLPDPLR